MTDIDPKELSRYGKILEAHQDWRLAGNIYVQFLRQNIRSVEGFAGLARVLSAQGKNEEALRVLENGWTNTSSGELSQLLAEKYDYLLERCNSSPEYAFELAARSVKKGLALDRALRALIRYAAPLKRHVEAAELLERARVQCPERTLDLLHAIATLYYQAGHEKKARETLFALLDEDPGHAGGLRLFDALCMN